VMIKSSAFSLSIYIDLAPSLAFFNDGIGGLILNKI